MYTRFAEAFSANYTLRLHSTILPTPCLEATWAHRTSLQSRPDPGIPLQATRCLEHSYTRGSSPRYMVGLQC